VPEDDLCSGFKVSTINIKLTSFNAMIPDSSLTLKVEILEPEQRLSSGIRNTVQMLETKDGSLILMVLFILQISPILSLILKVVAVKEPKSSSGIENITIMLTKNGELKDTILLVLLTDLFLMLMVDLINKEPN